MSEPTTLVAFDCSNGFCEAAILRGGAALGERSEPLTRANRDRLFPILLDMLAETGVQWGDVDALAVGVGPGNFTGIRQGIAAARGLALSLQRPAIGVNRFEALAHGVTGRALVTATGPGRAVHCFLSPSGTRFTAEPDRIEIEDPETLLVIGVKAAEIADRLGAKAAAPPTHPATAAALIAGTRLDGDPPPPVPDYVLPPNATPSATPAS